MRSEELARQVLPAYELETIPGLYELRIRPAEGGVEWIGRDECGGEERLNALPGSS